MREITLKHSINVGVGLLSELFFECGFIVVPCYVYYFHRIGDTTGKLLNISTRFTQLELGISALFGGSNYLKYAPYITDTWITHIWQYIHSCGVKMTDDDFWTYKLPRRHDFFLMDEVISSILSVEQKQIFNQIRLYMKLISASDLFYPNTNVMKAEILECEPMKSTFGFPYVKPFPKNWKKTWKSIILTFINHKQGIFHLGNQCRNRISTTNRHHHMLHQHNATYLPTTFQQIFLV